MTKRFNITGNCFPNLHYMMDNSAKLAEVVDLVERGEYFIINRPRQFGKTTTLFYLNDYFQNDDYLSIILSLQGIDSQHFESDVAFAKMFIQQLKNAIEYQDETLYVFLEQASVGLTDMDSLSKLITKFIHKTSKKVILLIDEVDASSNFKPLLNFLGMLRSKYLGRALPKNYTFHSVVLAGIHDIKSLKFKLRNPEEERFESPWNIATDFKVRMTFNPKEIAPMLEQYCKAENVKMDIPLIAERLYYYTSGYPFLVSKLCKTVAEDILPKREDNLNNYRNWTLNEIEDAVKLVLKENNTNFDDLIKNLENNEDLYKLVHQILIEGDNIFFNQHNPTIHLGVMYGVFKKNGRLKIHNKIYEQLIYNYMSSVVSTSLASKYNYGYHFTLENNALDMKAVLLKFQQFMKEQYSQQDESFLERQGRLIFLAFLAPILNGNGYSFREVQASEEKRLDIIVTYFQHRYIFELKRWYGEKAHQRGLKQLADYLDIHNVKNGYLIIFDDRKERNWETKTIEFEGKQIYAIWV